MGEMRPNGSAIRFGVFELDARARELRKQGIKIKLQDQPFQVLQVLLERPSEVVSREELQQRVWPPDTFVDFDHGLHNAIKKLREALGDSADAPRYIETIPKRGYRFIAPITANRANGRGAATRSAPGQPPMTDARRWLRGLAWGLVAAGVSAIVILAVSPRSVLANLRHLVAFESHPSIRSLAVLPLQNLSGDPAQDYFADGMTEELITELSRISALKIISRTSVMIYKGTHKSLPEIARELKVDAIVEGSVLRSGNRVRITAQLIYAPQDRNVWAQSYEHDFEDILAMQKTVASAIVDEIRVKITPGERSQLRSVRPVNLKAHEAYLQGLYHLQQGRDIAYKKSNGKLSEKHVGIAADYFQLAIQADPNYAPPYVALWEAWYLGALPARDWSRRARPLLLKAVQLDDNSANAHCEMAGFLMNVDWDWKGAEREYQRAIQLEPSSVDAHGGYAGLLFKMGRAQEGLKETELLQSLDPRNDHMAAAFYWMRQFDRAIELYRAQAQRKPNDFDPHFALSNIYALTGRHQEAISELQAMDTVQDYRELAAALGSIYASAGYERALQLYAARLQVYARTSYIPEWYIASIYGFLGDKDQAFVWLEKTYESRDGIDTLADPMWDPLRSDPRFTDLVRRVGLPSS